MTKQTSKARRKARPELELAHYDDERILAELYKDEDRQCYFATSSPEAELETGKRRIQSGAVTVGRPPAALLLHGRLTLPPPPHPESQDAGKLFRDLLEFVKQHVCWSPEFAIGAVAYTMATWIYERFQFFGYLQFIGPPGTGKTRSLDVLRAICYHGVKLSSSTGPVIYRLVAQCHPTLLMDEVDEAFRREMANILRDGTSHDGQVIRCNPETYRPESYSCFGPKVCGGQEPVTDPALASRIIQENMSMVPRGHKIGLILPGAFEQESAILRSRLLRWKLDNFWGFEVIDPGGDDPRQRQLFMPLFSVAPEEFTQDLRSLMARQSKSAHASMRDTFDGEVVAALKELESPEIVRPCEIAESINALRGMTSEGDRWNRDRVTPAKVGHALNRIGITDGGRDQAGRFYRVRQDQLNQLYRSYLDTDPLTDVTEAETEDQPSAPRSADESG